MQSLYESTIFCISKSQSDDIIKIVYQKRLSEIFQSERKPLNFLITPYILIDPKYETVKSTINLYTKNLAENIKDFKKPENINAIKDKAKKTFCYMNKNDEYKNISFIDQISTFYEKTLFFIRYINNMGVDNPNYETKIVEISRCGFNMGEILKNMGYTEKENFYLVGYYYQYKYFPIICYYTKIQDEDHIFLKILGYYTENSKNEIISEMDKIKEQLGDLFYIQSIK